MRKATRQERREADRAFKRFGERGCCRCGHRPVPGGAELLVRVPGGDLRAIHAECLLRSDTVFGTGAFISNDPPHIDDDRIWFEQNPGRVARLRRPHDRTEIPLILARARVEEQHLRGTSKLHDKLLALVRSTPINRVGVICVQIKPGVRFRRPVSLEKADLESYAPESIDAIGGCLLEQMGHIEMPTQEQYRRLMLETQLQAARDIMGCVAEQEGAA